MEPSERAKLAVDAPAAKGALGAAIAESEFPGNFANSSGFAPCVSGTNLCQRTQQERRHTLRSAARAGAEDANAPEQGTHQVDITEARHSPK